MPIAGLGTITGPLVLARLAVHPNGETENLTRLVIDDDARIAAAVLFLRKQVIRLPSGIVQAPTQLVNPGDCGE